LHVCEQSQVAPLHGHFEHVVSMGGWGLGSLALNFDGAAPVIFNPLHESPNGTGRGAAAPATTALTEGHKLARDIVPESHAVVVGSLPRFLDPGADERERALAQLMIEVHRDMDGFARVVGHGASPKRRLNWGRLTSGLRTLAERRLNGD
jgi:hypothetical protein